MSGFDLFSAHENGCLMSNLDSQQPMLTRDEEDQLQRALNGSGSALGEVLQSLRKYLLLIADEELGAHLKSKVSPSDVVQDSFLEVRRDLSRFQGKNHQQFVAWVRRILLNNIANVIRDFCQTACRSVHRELSLDNAVGGDLADDGSGKSPSGRAVRNEQLALLHNAIAALPPHYQDVICWRNYERLSFVEIGIRLQRSEEAARKLWVRALELLEQELDVLNDSISGK